MNLRDIQFQQVKKDVSVLSWFVRCHVFTCAFAVHV